MKLKTTIMLIFFFGGFIANAQGNEGLNYFEKKEIEDYKKKKHLENQKKNSTPTPRTIIVKPKKKIRVTELLFMDDTEATIHYISKHFYKIKFDYPYPLRDDYIYFHGKRGEAVHKAIHELTFFDNNSAYYSREYLNDEHQFSRRLERIQDFEVFEKKMSSSTASSPSDGRGLSCGACEVSAAWEAKIKENPVANKVHEKIGEPMSALRESFCDSCADRDKSRGPDRQ